ncbi:hypothetical protein B5S32_g4143 [[Candida] boidinii]|nr:hypothetical protein B5S32_g4143 [[Candida] boidinii]
MVSKRSIESVELPVTTVKSSEDVPSVVIGSFFNGLEVPASSEFELYKHKKRDGYLLHGENDGPLEYNGLLEDANNSQKYCIAVYDPSHKSIELINSLVIPTKVTSKEKRKLKGPKVKQLNVRNNIQRNALGEAFGTKKAKKAIADMERNRIDSGKLEEEQVVIIDSIRSNTSNMPTKQEMEDTMNKDRLIPEFDVEATRVEDIYPLENIIPKKEWSFLRVDSILSETDIEKKSELLCYSNSKYLLKKLGEITNETVNKKEKAQILYYISVLMGVYANRRCHNKDKLLENLNSPPGIVIDSVLQRFTVSRAGEFGKSKDRSFTIDPAHEDKLLSFMLALILHSDNFHLEVSVIAQELSLKPSRLVGLLRSLGCIVKNATVAEAESLNISKSMAANYKIASLKVPFKVPEISRRGRRN